MFAGTASEVVAGGLEWLVSMASGDFCSFCLATWLNALTLCAFDYHYLKKVHQWRDAASLDFKLIGKKQASACLPGRWVYPYTSDQLVYAFSRPHRNCFSEAQWGSQMVWQCLKRLYLHVPGAVMSLTKLFWRFLNDDKSRKIKSHLKYYIKCSRISVFSASIYCKKTIFGI